MRFATGLALSIALLSGAYAADEKKAEKFEPSKLEGEWTFVEGTKMGTKSDAKALAAKVIITKDTLTIKDDAVSYVMGYTLDTKTSPVGIDLVGKDGPVKDQKAKGIVAFEGDKLKICYDMDSSKRPAEFASKKDSMAMYFILKKAGK